MKTKTNISLTAKKTESNKCDYEKNDCCFIQWRKNKRTGIGSFENSLYDLFYKAGAYNREKIVLAFPEFFGTDLNIITNF